MVMPMDQSTVCEEYGVPQSVALGVIQAESSFTATAANGSCYGYTRTHEAEIEKMLRAEIAHNIAEYVMEHDAVVYERQEEENNDLQLSATFRFLQPHEGEWKI